MTKTPDADAGRTAIEQDLLERVATHHSVREAEEVLERRIENLLNTCKANGPDEALLARAHEVRDSWGDRCRRIAAVVDATLRSGPDSDLDARLQRDLLLEATQKSVTELAKLYEGPGGFIATDSGGGPSATRTVPEEVERLRAVIAICEDKT